MGIKFLFGATMFIISVNMYCQSNDSVSKIKQLKYSFVSTNFDSIRKLNNSLTWTAKKALKSSNFSIYNKTTKANDLYILNDGAIQYSKSGNLIENNFRNNKIDSFNPNGAPNIQSGVLMGVFNLFLKN